LTWQVHIHAVIETKHRDTLTALLKKKYQSSGEIYRPVFSEEFDNSAKGLSYVCKPGFRRKAFFWSKKTQSWKNKEYALAAADDVELMEWLAQAGLRERLVSKGIDLIEGGAVAT
jgi:hypothetical protein